MRTPLILAALLLSGCAASVDGMGKRTPGITFESDKAPDIVANCLATSVYGGGDVMRLSDDHYIVIRKNGYGMIMVRWDFFGSPTGSRIEMRSQTPFGEAVDKAKACAA